jgi:acyl-CoA synthetase (AMP-forming)/AMP-acid ligase II
MTRPRAAASLSSDPRPPTPDPRPPTPDPRLLAPAVNVGFRLTATAAANPNGKAVVMPVGRRPDGKRGYDWVTFRELDDDSNLIADGLMQMGVKPGTRLVLMVPPSIEFISLVFAMFKAGVVTVLIDPGMGRRNLIRCLAESEPGGFIGIPLAQAVRSLLRFRFPKATHNVTVGRRWFWGGKTLSELRTRHLSKDFRPVQTHSDDPAAIIFTTGSTGPPKGVLYRHGNFDRQATEIRDFYNIQPGEIDLPGFPLFALFNCAMGVTTVIPDMDPTQPANVDPRNIIEAINDWNVTQAFGSPALWNVVGRYCDANKIVLPTLKRVLSAGAPVPVHVLKRMKAAIPPDGDVHTPYGATEALPVASISATEVFALNPKSKIQNPKSDGGNLGPWTLDLGQSFATCVGRHFPGIEWRIICITDEPIASVNEAEELPPGEIGELIVRGPVVTTEYVTRSEWNRLSKICDGDTFWHRMGDVGYLEPVLVGQTSHLPESGAEHGRPEARPTRFWFCGRKSHRIITPRGTLFTIPCEAVFNQHPWVYRSALVGAGPRGQQTPVIFVEAWPEHRRTAQQNVDRLIAELRQLASQHPHTADIKHFVVLWGSLPVDIRHNAKIFREKLVPAAEQIVARQRPPGS